MAQTNLANYAENASGWNDKPEYLLHYANPGNCPCPPQDQTLDRAAMAQMDWRTG